MKTYNQMFIDQIKYERRTERAVSELEQKLKELTTCKRCTETFLPEPKNRSICNVCKYGDNDDSQSE